MDELVDEHVSKNLNQATVQHLKIPLKDRVVYFFKDENAAQLSNLFEAIDMLLRAVNGVNSSYFLICKIMTND